MRMRFGRVERRALIEGTCGWGEFSPFPEHPALPCACGLATVAPLRGD
ncbi:MAG: o-succinylbenzoate synthase, partial [Egibacteraceae bacterium]